jgi:hypothetical protein
MLAGGLSHHVVQNFDEILVQLRFISGILSRPTRALFFTRPWEGVSGLSGRLVRNTHHMNPPYGDPEQPCDPRKS